MKTHILHIYLIIHSNKTNYLVLLGGKMQLVLPKNILSGKKKKKNQLIHFAVSCIVPKPGFSYFLKDILTAETKISFRVLEVCEFLLGFGGLGFFPN